MTTSLRPFRGALADVDLTLLREFVEIVAAGGITAAEARLGKGKSAISLGLARLEERIGLRLCERGRSGFRLTEQGQLVHAAALQLFAEVGRFTDFVGTAARKLEGEVSLIADDSFALVREAPLARAIARIGEAFPALRIEVQMGAPDRVFTEVLEGGVDLGFTALIRESEALEAVEVGKEATALYCAPGHPFFPRDDASITRDELRGQAFVAAAVMQDPDYARFMSELKIMAKAPTILSRMILIRSARYLGFVPRDFAAPWVARGELRELMIEGARSTNRCYLIHRRARPLGLGASIFRDMLIDELRAEAS